MARPRDAIALASETTSDSIDEPAPGGQRRGVIVAKKTHRRSRHSAHDEATKARPNDADVAPDDPRTHADSGEAEPDASAATETATEAPEAAGAGDRAPDAAAEAAGGEPAEADEAQVASSDEPRPIHKLSRKELLARLLEKNDLLMRLQRDNSRKDKELKEVKDRFLRSVAEFENYRRRSRKEWELLKHQAKVDVILGVLEIVDDFERALAVVSEDDTSDLVQGIRLIYNNLQALLERHGVHEVPGAGSRFDPVHHMAVGQIETDAVESGHVAEVVQKGYQVGDSVIRPARVIVAK